MKTLDEMIREYRIELYKACDGRIGLQAWKYKGKPGAEEEIRANKDALVAELVRRERERKTNEERKHREHILNLQIEQLRSQSPSVREGGQDRLTYFLFGFCWSCIYRLMISSGAPPQLTMQ